MSTISGVPRRITWLGRGWMVLGVAVFCVPGSYGKILGASLMLYGALARVAESLALHLAATELRLDQRLTAIESLVRGTSQ